MKTTKMTTTHSAVGLLLSLIFAGCVTATVSRVTITQGDQQLTAGEEVTLTADVVASGAISTDVTWSSDTPNVATVDSGGTVTAIDVGTATVTATSAADASKNDSVAITVNPAPGSTLWTRQFGTSDTDSGWGVAIDASGNVLVIGHTTGGLEGSNLFGSFDPFVRKIDPNGKHLWTRQFGTSYDDFAWDVAVDASGNVLVAGYTQGRLGDSSAGGIDAFVRKIGANGDHLWTRQFGTTDDDFAWDVAVDASGNVLIAGRTRGALEGSNAGYDDAFVRKIDPDGNHLWTRQFGTNLTDDSRSVATDGSGNVLVAGVTYGDLGGSNAGNTLNADAFVRKIDHDGNHLWTRQFGTSSHDYAKGVASDVSGNVVVTGYTFGGLEGSNAGNRDAFVRKVDPDGAHLWTGQFGTSSADFAESVATDVSGNVFATGYTDGVLEGSSAGQRDAFVRKTDPNGNHLWTRQFGTSNSDYAFGVASDASGKVVVTGYTDGGLEGSGAGGDDAFVRAYTP